ncbi:MAG: tRNA epoxyqueuosine(34) reductase QueG [Magnetococcus sp. DMHC-6]
MTQFNLPLHELKESLRHQSIKEGFEIVRFAAPKPPAAGVYFSDWLTSEGYGQMAWMAKDPEIRLNPKRFWPTVGVILVLGCNDRPPTQEVTWLAGKIKISSYARHADYHTVLRQKMQNICLWLEGELGYKPNTRLCVDSAPVLEKPLAAACGVGWQGKNTLLVSRRFGCWLFLSEIFLELPLEPDPPDSDHCGTCQRCQKACPTQALEVAYRLDVQGCLAYYSIEHKGPIPREIRPLFGNRVYGCDDCLTVCPWNRFAPPTQHAEFVPLASIFTLATPWDCATLTPSTFAKLFQKSPIKRIGLERFLRNLCVVMGNSRDLNALDSLMFLLRHPSLLVQGHAAWGLGQLGYQEAIVSLKKQRNETTDLWLLEEIQGALRRLE